MSNWKGNLLHFIAAAFLITLAAVAPTLAQARATGGAIEGTVTDPTGAVVAGATVTVKNIQNGLEREVTTAEDGVYRIPALDVGTYDISIKVEGFAPQTVRTELLIGRTSVVNFSLTVGSSGGEIINVTADAASIVETTRTQQSANVNDRAIRELPVNGRNFLEFVRLTPGVNTDPRGGDISFGGLRGTANSLLIDGADNNNTFFGQTIGRTGSGRGPYQFSQSSVREFQVNTNSFSAEFGRAGGAVINVVTKSGTNEFHGDANIYFRDRSLNAEESIAKANRRPKPRNRIYQFGGTLGGPIAKDRAFFFFNYDGQRNTEPQPVILGVAPPSDPVSQAVANQLRAFTGNYDRKFDQDVFIGKVDWRINDKNQYSVRYNRQNFTGTNLENSGPQSALEHTGNSLVTTDTLTNQLTTIVKPNLINELRVLFSRDKEPGASNSTNPEADIRQGGIPILAIGRNNFSPRETTEKRFQVIDTMSYLRGAHNMKFGVDVVVNRIFNFFPGLFSGVYSFTSYADFADGKPGGGYRQAFAGEGTDGPISRPNSNEFAAFFQDDWSVTPRLKFYLGVRYDVQRKSEPPIANSDPQLAAFNISTKGINQDTNNFAPRLGFAWQPFDDGGKTVIRGGYGIFYGRTPSIMLGTAHTQNGISVRTLSFSGDNVPSYPGNFTTPPTTGVPATPSLYFFAKDYVDPMIHQGSFGIERELTKDLSLSVSWLMVRGVRQSRSRDINFSAPVSQLVNVRTSTAINFANGQPLGTLTGTLFIPRYGARPATRFDRLTQFESTGDSIYHGLVVALNKRFSQNFQGLISYTWSHAIDNKPDQTSVVVGVDDFKNQEDPLNTAAERGDGESDTRHRFVLSYSWDLAYARNLSNPVAKAILDGWSLSGILTATSGRPYSATVGGDLNGDRNARTDRAPGFSRNTFTTDNFVNVDMRLTRTINLTEKYRLQFFAEGFNLFNRFNVGTVNTNRLLFAVIQGTPTVAPNSTFGQPLTSLGARQFQLAARFVF
ncbi:MAG: TonB-dependent receptor [Acidobacteria bacterium]|nr:TonB-dependent receptor [Acidobacteriota bacterium]